MTVYNDVQLLENNLPAFLEQNYEPGYEVIVVDESSTDDTPDMLKLFKARYPHLYSTFLPKPDIQVSRQRLALTLGVKAAKKDWIIFTDISRVPDNREWLNELAQYASTPTQLILGYKRPKTDDLRLQLFDSVDEAGFIIGKTERKQAHGHRGKRMRYLRGKYDFIAVPTRLGHDALRHYERNLHGWRLLGRRLHIALHNLFH